MDRKEGIMWCGRNIVRPRALRRYILYLEIYLSAKLDDNGQEKRGRDYGVEEILCDHVRR